MHTALTPVGCRSRLPLSLARSLILLRFLHENFFAIWGAICNTAHNSRRVRYENVPWCTLTRRNENEMQCAHICTRSKSWLKQARTEHIFVIHNSRCCWCCISKRIRSSRWRTFSSTRKEHAILFGMLLARVSSARCSCPRDFLHSFLFVSLIFFGFLFYVYFWLKPSTCPSFSYANYMINFAFAMWYECTSRTRTTPYLDQRTCTSRTRTQLLLLLLQPEPTLVSILFLFSFAFHVRRSQASLHTHILHNFINLNVGQRLLMR